jgi:hypothetical protein
VDHKVNLAVGNRDFFREILKLIFERKIHHKWLKSRVFANQLLDALEHALILSSNAYLGTVIGCRLCDGPTDTVSVSDVEDETLFAFEQHVLIMTR